MRLFEHFPQEGKNVCPICKTKDDKPCFLMPISGTRKNGICEAQPTHAECVQDNLHNFVLDNQLGIMFLRV
jgi:hypothetical protein